MKKRAFYCWGALLLVLAYTQAAPVMAWEAVAAEEIMLAQTSHTDRLQTRREALREKRQQLRERRDRLTERRRGLRRDIRTGDPEPESPGAGQSCAVGGCSGQLCLPQGETVITTCEWKQEYACYGQFGACEAQPDGQCGWTPTAQLTACLAQY